jgi:hypothetical protein
MVALREFLAGYGRRIFGRADDRADQQLAGVLCGELPVGYANRAVEQPASNEVYRRSSVVDRGETRRSEAQHHIRADQAGLAGSRLAETYDLVNAGPRHRFTVLGSSGPLLVHNCENETQAGCRDLLVDAMLAVESEGLPISMHIHDEVIAEVPTGSLTDERMIRLMCKVPTWAEGLPVAVELHRGKRYRK